MRPVPPLLAATLLVAVAIGAARVAHPQNEASARDELARYGRDVASGGGGMAEGMACLPCHGRDGQGDAETGVPRIAGLPARYLLKQLDDYAEERRAHPIMTPIAKTMTGRQRLGSALHYASLSTREDPIPAPRNDPARVQRGATLYVQGSAELGLQGCINCHGPDGVGAAYAYPPLAGQHAPYVEAQLRAWRDGTRRNSIAGVMDDISKRLGEEHGADVAAYLAALQARRLP